MWQPDDVDEDVDNDNEDDGDGDDDDGADNVHTFALCRK